MEVRHFAKSLVLDSRELEIVVSAFEAAQLQLDLRNADVVNNERLAKALIEVVRAGERDAQKMVQRAIQKFLR
jgi:hypothetical protein